MPIGKPITLTNNVASRIVSTTATEGQTTFTVSGGYRINAISVFRNGVRLDNSLDFIASDGASVVLTVGAGDGDEISFQIFDDFRVADAIVSAASTQTIYGDLTVTGTVSGASIGIQSSGNLVGAAQTINFVGTGNTVVDRGGGVIDVSISGGGGIGTVVNYGDNTPTPFSYIDNQASVNQNLTLDNTNSGGNPSVVISVNPTVIVESGVGLTVGVDKSLVLDALQLSP